MGVEAEQAKLIAQQRAAARAAHGPQDDESLFDWFMRIVEQAEARAAAAAQETPTTKPPNPTV